MSGKFGVTIDLSGLRIKEALQEARQAVKDGLMEYGETVLVPEAKELCPVDQKRNSDTIKFEMVEESEGEITAQLQTESGYGGYIEIGTGLYGPQKSRVVPVTKKVLAWQDKNDEWHYAKSTKGMHARPYMYPAFLATKHRIIDIIREKIARIGSK